MKLKDYPRLSCNLPAMLGLPAVEASVPQIDSHHEILAEEIRSSLKQIPLCKLAEKTKEGSAFRILVSEAKLLFVSDLDSTEVGIVRGVDLLPAHGSQAVTDRAFVVSLPFGQERENLAAFCDALNRNLGGVDAGVIQAK